MEIKEISDKCHVFAFCSSLKAIDLSSFNTARKYQNAHFFKKVPGVNGM